MKSEEKLRELLESNTVDAIIDEKLEELSQRPEGVNPPRPLAPLTGASLSLPTIAPKR